uniref:Uncharacterized protein n=1 Tax=Panagrellus redivivus TaxID=6233 RepID=A0A7E4VWQ3_PANRE
MKEQRSNGLLPRNGQGTVPSRCFELYSNSDLVITIIRSKCTSASTLSSACCPFLVAWVTTNRIDPRQL